MDTRVSTGGAGTVEQDTTGHRKAAAGRDGADGGTAADGAAPMDRQTAERVIAGARERIDGLDERIIALIRERMDVSAEVQRARLASGGRRLSLNREMEILGRYHETLGRPGTTLAMTLLELCRGKL
jgi:chorismate mutase